MYGAVIGDLAGSIYEYPEFLNSRKKIINKEIRRQALTKSLLIEDNAFFSDDTILTIAILDSILNKGKKSYSQSLKEYGVNYRDFKPKFTPYFTKIFSPGFVNWLDGKTEGNSIGNGCAMRVSPVGFMFNNLGRVLDEARESCCPTHLSVDGIYGAKAVAESIFLYRKGMSSEDSYKMICKKYNYPFEYNLKELRESHMFSSKCATTVPICLYIAAHSDSFEEAIRNTFSIGGDTDTNCCIVGGLAEAKFGVPEYLVSQAKTFLPQEFIDILEKGYSLMCK